MKRPNEHITISINGETQGYYKEELEIYIDYLEKENKQLILNGVGISKRIDTK